MQTELDGILTTPRIIAGIEIESKGVVELFNVRFHDSDGFARYGMACRPGLREALCAHFGIAELNALVGRAMTPDELARAVIETQA